jgi:hypothetical protein
LCRGRWCPRLQGSQTHSSNIACLFLDGASNNFPGQTQDPLLEPLGCATVIVLEETDFAGMNEEWLTWFPTDPPARQGAKLPVRIPGIKVSSAVIAEA